MSDPEAKEGGSEPSGSSEAPADPHMRMSIDELENADKCCTLCPPMIRCVCCKREEHEKLVKATKGFFGSRRRKCTDILCLLFFLAFWVGMIVIGAIALSQGNAEAILYGTDYTGKTCGVGTRASTKLTAYPRVLEDFLLNAGESNPAKWQFYGVCVSSCPDALDVLCNDVPKKEVPAIENSQAELRWCLTDGADGTAPPDGESFCTSNKVDGNCWIIPTETKSTLFRCIPVINTTSSSSEKCTYPPGITNANDPSCLVKKVTSSGVSEQPAQESKLLEQLGTIQSLWSRYFGDIQRAFVPILVSSVAVVVVLGIVYLLLLQFCTGLIVGLTIILVLLGLVAVAAFSYVKAGVFTSPAFASAAASSFGVALDTASTESTQQSFAVMAYVFTAMAVLALILVIVLRNSIATAVATISLASQALRKNSTLLLTPIISTVGVIALLAWWAFTAASLMSITNPVTVGGLANITVPGAPALYVNATAFTGIESDSTMTYLQFYNLFGLLWTGQFILYISFLTIAGTASSWYFARDNGECEADGVPVFSVEDEPSPCCGLLSCSFFRSHCFQACHRTWRFHLGSVAFASFVVAVIAAIRLFVSYVQKKMEQAKANNNTVLRAVMCYIQYYLSVIDCLVRMMSRTAFVFVAIKGHSFIPATGKALSFVVNNLGTFGMLNALSMMIFFLGKLLMAGAAAGVCYAILENAGTTYEVTSTWLPAAVTFIFGYIVAATFLDLYDACIDTILVAFVLDSSENDGKRYHNKDAKAAASGDDVDMAEEVEQAKGVQDGSRQPKQARGCWYYLCCCCFCSRGTATSAEEGGGADDAATGGGADE